MAITSPSPRANIEKTSTPAPVKVKRHPIMNNRLDKNSRILLKKISSYFNR